MTAAVSYTHLDVYKRQLEWIVLDEAHTYVGSQAAELALLIRRVVHAFAVKPENLRFVATSATMGDPDGPAGERLREFLAQVAGVDVSRVHLVSGARQIPLLPSASDSCRLSVAELRAIDSGKDETPNRYRALSGHPIAVSYTHLDVYKRQMPM